MHRLLVLFCALVLIVGCGKSKDSAKRDGGGGGSSSSSGETKVEKKFSSAPVQLVYEYIVGIYQPAKVQVKGTPREQQTTFKKSPAVAVHVSWTENDDPHDHLAIVQDGRVTYFDTYDTSKSFEENVAAAGK